MELINRYSQKTLTEEEVFIFPVTLCDNDVDRDFEAFGDECLEDLKRLFVGKTGVFDHEAIAGNQAARIFFTEIETDENRRTVAGAQYKRLRAKAYMVRTKDNESLIKEIDGGIKKEVSISCSAAEKRCSICGKAACAHKKGRTYSGKLAFKIITGASDAYEWSFVAVPAQRNAGVSKAFNPETLKACVTDGEENTVIKAKELRALLERLERAEKGAAFGECYREALLKKLRVSFTARLGGNADTLMRFAKSLDAEELEKLAAEAEISFAPQLSKPADADNIKYYR